MKVENTQDDVRAAFESAAKESEAADVVPVDAGSNEPVADDSGSAAADVPVASESAPVSTESRVRGPDGKFTKKTETAAPVAAKADTTKAPVAADATQTPAPVTATQTAVKAPQSWRADVREKFAALPAEVQAEVLRREAEVAQTLQTIAPAKRLQQALAPYEADAKAQGADLTAMLPGIMQTVTSLAKGSEKQRAQILAKMVSGYGVTVESLAEALGGATQPGSPTAINPDVIAQQAEERVFQRLQAQRQQQLQQSAVQEIESFISSGQAEFLEDVREDMAILFERGRAKTPAEAYELACRMNPDVFKVVQQREAAKAAQAQQQNVAKAKGAAVSVRSAPAVSPIQREESGNTIDDIRATIAQLSGGGTR